ncbi:MAG: SDR family oxidoreductase [Chromatiales bacterium]|nr:SDR family oxidoreductase [Chromatiales bacterium]
MRILPVVLALAAALGVTPVTAADKTTVLITGANRGIGLEFVRQLSARDWKVIATARDPADATELQALAKADPDITIEKLDVTDRPGVDALAAKYKDQPIDLLINNAGKTPRYMSAFKQSSGVDYDQALQSYEINALGPLKVMSAFLPNVANSQLKKMVVISSKAGSFPESPKMPMMYEYRASKAALNMVVYTMSFETAKKGVTLVALSPGTVSTEPAEGELGYGQKMQAMPGSVTPVDSVTSMLKVIDGLTPAQNGQFLDFKDGRVIQF